MSALDATIALTSTEVIVCVRGAGMEQVGRAIFFAFAQANCGGCAVVPYRPEWEGSTVFLPRPINVLYAAQVRGDRLLIWKRNWNRAGWTDPENQPSGLRASVSAGRLEMTISLGSSELQRLANAVNESASGGAFLWTKDLAQHGGWGAVLPHGDGPTDSIAGDFALPEPDFAQQSTAPDRFAISWKRRAAPRARIYQLFPRLFGNTNETRKLNGTAAENGVGKFADITPVALRSLREELQMTHIWLTGVLAHATGTAFAEIGKSADDPDLLKGIAGSPYAIRDYGDVDADLAIDPARRMEEFKALVQRARAAGLKVIIDFVPNHVARNHCSGLVEFGRLDDSTQFFSPANNFFWLQRDSVGGGPPLRMPTIKNGQTISPTCRVLGGCDGLHDPEIKFGRVTGNNAATWAPSIWDWYETAKLNYGYDFTSGVRAFPNASVPNAPVPDTWRKMDSVLSYWQGFGVDGFRCDMAHMVPPEFWQWTVARARDRNPSVSFIAEAYNDDPMKVESADPLVRGFGSVTLELLNAGFDAVYDAASYKTLHRIYEGGAWANDLDGALGFRDGRIAPDFAFHRALRYAENHDEVRLASRGQWGGIGMNVGRPVSAILYALGRGAVLFYNGQEVGEPADGAEGFGGDDGRTTIFDYWSMPEFNKWVNGHRYDGAQLSAEQHHLRAFYGRLFRLIDSAPFRDGEFAPLNPHNLWNAEFGRIDGETASGHWLYAFLRYDLLTGEAFLVTVNLHPSATLNAIRVALPDSLPLAMHPESDGRPIRDELSDVEPAQFAAGANGILIPALPPLTPAFFRLQIRSRSSS